MKFKNMKIKVETDEHGESNLDEIVAELERLGYVEVWRHEEKPTTGYVEAFTNGEFEIYTSGFITALAELRSMNIETLKEM